MPASVNTALAVALALLFLWRVTVLVRSGATPDRVAAVLMFGAYAVPNATNSPAVAHLLGAPGRLLDNLALMVFNVAFVVFFAHQTGESHRALLRSRVQVPLAVAAMVVLTVAWAINPEGTPYYPYIGPSPTAQIVLFYVPAGLYLGYMQFVSAWLAWRAAKHPDTINSWPFWIAAAALLCQAIPTGIDRPVSILLRFTVGVVLPPTVESVMSGVLAVGIIGLALALFAIAAQAMVATHRYHRQVRRDFADLSTLWVLLYDRFPWIALPGTTRRGPGRSTVLQRPVYAFERRCTECRDGLWLLSPWASEDDADERPDPSTGTNTDPEGGLTIRAQARVVYHALHRSAAGEDPVGPPVALAAPASAADEDAPRALASAARADAAQLVALSRAVDSILVGGVRPAPAT